jgi:ABC-type multidrug transport system ATPase subunit
MSRASLTEQLVTHPPSHTSLEAPLVVDRSGRKLGTKPTLLVDSVTKRWPRQRDPVLRDVDLVLAAGQLAWLSGENGAGKTTLLRIIAGIIAPDRGAVRVCDLQASGERREYQRLIGLLTAGNSGLYARMTVRQHLDYWARLAMMRAQERGERVDEFIDRFTLGDLAKRRLDRMSMGQRQRVRIAMTFLHRPRLILLDEPANSLDTDGREVLIGAVERHQSEGGATLWCSPAGDELGTSVDLKLVLMAGTLQSRD